VAKRVEEITLGVDVCKDKLDIHHWETEEGCQIRNERGEISDFLGGLQGALRLAVEATSNYHMELVEVALKLGHTVYLVNARQLSHYREAVNVRNKSDALDAWLLARYLAHEAGSLRPLQLRDAKAQQLWTLLKRRAVVVEARKQLEQSFREIRLSTKALFSQIERLLARIDERLRSLLRALGWWPDYRRCQSIPGIGPLNAIALTAAYHRGAFASSDAFISFIGFDVRVRESGKYKGLRKLSKRGEAELRRLLYCATKPACSCPRFDRYYQRQLEKGMSKIAAKVALARKLARIAFTLLANQQTFRKSEVPA
jgi:transposase